MQCSDPTDNYFTIDPSSFYSFIRKIYITHLRNLLVGAPRPTTAIKVRSEQLAEQFGSNWISKESEFQIEGATTENAPRCMFEVFTRGTKGSTPEEVTEW